MNRLISFLLSLFIALPAHAAGPVIWGPGGAQNISSGPVYDNSIPYIKQPQTNYIANQSGVIDTTGWGVSGAVTVTRVTSSLPRATTVGTGLSLAAGSADDYAYYCWTIDDADVNTKLQWSWSQAPGSYADGDFDAQVYSFTSASCGGSATELALSTDNSSGDTEIPNYDGAYYTTFDTTDALYYGIRYVRKAGSSTLVLSNVMVGPGNIVAVPAMGNWTDMPSGSVQLRGSSNGLEFTNYQVNFARYRRNQDTMHGKVEIQFTGAPGTGTGAFSIIFPTGAAFTVDSTKTGTSGRQTIGVGRYQLAAGSGSVNTFLEYSSYLQGGFTTVRASDSTSIGATSPAAFASGDKLFYEFWLPISEWAGAPNYAGQNDVTFVSDDGSADVFGLAGSLVPNQAVGTAVDRDIVFSSPQASNSIQIEYNYAGGGWGPNDMFPMNVQGPKQYGVRGWWVSSTTYRVRFGNGGTTADSATYAQNGSESWADRYAAGDRYRLVYAKAGAAVGFGLAGEEGRAGLVSREYTETYSTTWSDNGTGPGTSGSVSIVLQRIGNFVTAYIPAFGLTTGTGSPTSITSNTAMPAWARPTTAQRTFGGQAYANNATLDEVPQFIINTSGTIAVRRDPAGTSWGAGLANTGLEQPTTITWYAP